MRRCRNGGELADGRERNFVMTADIFTENVQTESNRMGIDRGTRYLGPGVTPTTSSEDSFSFSDNSECDEMHVHLGRWTQRHHGSRPYRSRPVVTSTQRDAAGSCRSNPMYG
jgi:hypothetical protein